MQLAEAYYDIDDMKNAIRAGREAVKVNPDHINGWRYLGDALRKSGDPGSAEPILRHAIEMQPEMTSTRYQLALALADLGRNQEATHEAQELLWLSPDHHGAKALIERLAQKP